MVTPKSRSGADGLSIAANDILLSALLVHQPRRHRIHSADLPASPNPPAIAGQQFCVIRPTNVEAATTLDIYLHSTAAQHALRELASPINFSPKARSPQRKLAVAHLKNFQLPDPSNWPRLRSLGNALAATQHDFEAFCQQDALTPPTFNR